MEHLRYQNGDVIYFFIVEDDHLQTFYKAKKVGDTLTPLKQYTSRWSVVFRRFVWEESNFSFVLESIKVLPKDEVLFDISKYHWTSLHPQSDFIKDVHRLEQLLKKKMKNLYFLKNQ